MASDGNPDILLSVPIYIQAPPIEGGDRNRHILINVRLLHVDDDSVRLEAVWNSLEAMPYGPVGVTGIVVPRRVGLQVFLPRDPFVMPIYVIITRQNRFGSRYQLGAAVHLHEWIPGIIEVDIDFLRIRRRNVHRSSVLSIVHARDVASTRADVNAENDNQDAVDGEAADSTDMQE
ncbi:uncharacterized protein TRAVEDRAFT_17222 [Trametes versicolor FP-101664 SS1]|uniref:uncharacterized protein n=1 Tax=Trametes versicolor (strain FP-101664) TaxID=717944 RepID=UPI000462397D|nr:uncharacterized protein TRAVEDRAFT_17222 [Trametes versicolor FP-101664 SS1]EIW62572.1 hypothetical protein TRAVEDRAFT_17222 [Trametes versicolor FP-101664 SS1]